MITRHAMGSGRPLFTLPGGRFYNATKPLEGRILDMKLTSENVHAVASDCLFTETEMQTVDDVPDGAVVVEGILSGYAFHPQRLESHRSDVASMLDDLTDDFKTSGGGGMSFLNACYTKYGEHWGEHPSMGMLFALGIGLGLAKYTLPREMWPALPGEMPYLTVNTAALSPQP